MNLEKEIQNLKKQNKGLMIAVGILILLQLGSMLFNGENEPEDAESMIQEILEDMGENEMTNESENEATNETQEVEEVSYVTDEQCFQVQINMSMEEVKATLGEPHETDKSVSTGGTFHDWYYNTDENYNRCVIKFENDKVTAIF